jgi:hypothetical protein
MNVLYWQAKHTNLFKYLSLGEIFWQTRPLVPPPGEMESATDIPTVFWMSSSRGKVTLVYTTRWPPTLSVVDVKKHLERCNAAHCDLILVVKLKNVCFSPEKLKGYRTSEPNWLWLGLELWVVILVTSVSHTCFIYPSFYLWKGNWKCSIALVTSQMKPSFFCVHYLLVKIVHYNGNRMPFETQP